MWILSANGIFARTHIATASSRFAIISLSLSSRLGFLASFSERSLLNKAAADCNPENRAYNFCNIVVNFRVFRFRAKRDRTVYK